MFLFMMTALLACNFLIASENQPLAMYYAIKNKRISAQLGIYHQAQVKELKRDMSRNTSDNSLRIPRSSGLHILQILDENSPKELYFKGEPCQDFLQDEHIDLKNLPQREKIEIVNFYWCTLSCIPQELNPETLRELIIHNNFGIKIKNLDLKPFANLTKLVLDYCGMNTLPEDLEHLTRLTKLSMRGNILKGDEPEWNRLQKLPLTSVNIRISNKVPAVLAALKLKELKFHLCKELFKTEENLKALAALTSLEILKLKACDIEKVPKELEQMPHLKKLNLSWNNGLNIADFDWKLLPALRKLSIRNIGGASLPTHFNEKLEEIVVSDNRFNEQELQEVIARSPNLKIVPHKNEHIIGDIDNAQ